MQLTWDVQDRGIYHVDVTTTNAALPQWFSVGGYTNGSVPGEYTMTLTGPGGLPPYGVFRMRVTHTPY